MKTYPLIAIAFITNLLLLTPSISFAGDTDCRKVKNGQSIFRTRYLERSAEECSSEEQSRTCTDGVLSDWTGTYTYRRCKQVAPVILDCGDLANGESETRTRFLEQESQSCSSETQTRTCTDGLLSEWSGDYTYEACETIPVEDVVLTIEAESFAVNDYWQVCSSSQACEDYQSGALNNKHLITKEGQYTSTSAGYLTKAVSLPSSGTYYVWGKSARAGANRDWGLMLDGTPLTNILGTSTTDWEPAGVVSVSSTEVELVIQDLAADAYWAYPDAIIITNDEDFVPSAAPLNCGDLLDGQSQNRTRFFESEAEVCYSETQTQSCTNGELSNWSGSYTFESCTEIVPIDLDCGDLLNGQTESRNRFQEAESEICSSEVQTRSCNDGVLSDWSGSFTYESCTEVDLDCGDLLNGQTENRTRFMEAESETCSSETQARSCTDGILSEWSGSYTHESCTEIVLDCGHLLNGQSETRTRFIDAESETCSSEEQIRSCMDGVLSEWSGSYSYDACSLLPVEDFVMSVEAESFAVNEYWQVCSESQTCEDYQNGALNDGHIITLEGNYTADESGYLSQSISLPAAGTYYVWGRSARAGANRDWGLMLDDAPLPNVLGASTTDWELAGAVTVYNTDVELVIQDLAVDAYWAYPDAIIITSDADYIPPAIEEDDSQNTEEFIDVTLSWVAPVAREDETPIALSELSGYIIRYGTEIGVYPNTIYIDDPTATESFISDLDATPAVYYFVITSIDTDGQESQYSNMVTYMVSP